MGYVTGVLYWLWEMLWQPKETCKQCTRETRHYTVDYICFWCFYRSAGRL